METVIKSPVRGMVEILEQLRDSHLRQVEIMDALLARTYAILDRVELGRKKERKSGK